MGVRESLLNTITSVADSDFVRVVTSAGASSKATVRNLFKGFESNLSAKSSLTDSDYIRLVGSDNEAYKQSMSSVYDAIGVKYLGSFTASSDEDIIKAALTALKTAYSSEASSSTNKPKTIAFFRSGAWGFVGTAWIRSTRVQMEVTQTNSGAQFYALDDNGTQTVIAQPTRAEVDALNSKIKNVTLTATTSQTGVINLSTLLGIYMHTKPILNVVVLNANANQYAVLAATTGNTVFAIIRSTGDNAPIANTEVTLRVIYVD